MSLESEIYRLSFELSETIDVNDLNKLLGILASDGVYAMWVYANDKFKKDKEQKIGKIMKLIEELDNFVNGNKNNIDDKYFQNLAQDLNKLLFMKELLEKVFIYALYHAKAKGD
jgi:hypothetical protein